MLGRASSGGHRVLLVSRDAATALLRQRPESPQSSVLPILGVCGLVLASFVTFLLAPGSIEEKTHAALHGLCAQRPSHSIRLGGAILPFDARMSGIYIGAATTFLWLAAGRRLRASRLPPISALSALGVFVLLMAGDGVNGLLVDLGVPALYSPSNGLRIATGLLTGVALGVGLGHLLAVSLWAKEEHRRHIVERPRELLAPLAVGGAVCGLALTGWPVLYAPFAVGLLAAATGVFWVLSIVALTLITGRGWSYVSTTELATVAGQALVAAVTIIALLAWLRIASERFFGLPKFT